MPTSWKLGLYGGVLQDPSTWALQRYLSHPHTRVLKFRLNEPDEVEFYINGESNEVPYIRELETDIVVYRDGVALTRVRVGRSADSIGPTNYEVQFTCRSYEEILKRRRLDAGMSILTFASVTPQEQEEIGWNLINEQQTSFAYRALGITRGTGQTTGVARIAPYNANSYVEKNITETLVDVDNGFDWCIDSDLVYRVYYPERGETKAASSRLIYPGNVSEVTINFDPADYANNIYVQGKDDSIFDDGTTATLADGTDLAGSWETFIGVSDYIDTSQATARLGYEIARNETRKPSYTLALKPNAWTGPDMMWLGDTIPINIRRGRIDINEQARVVGITIVLLDNGGDKAYIILERLSQTEAFIKKMNDIQTRLSNLERNKT